MGVELGHNTTYRRGGIVFLSIRDCERMKRDTYFSEKTDCKVYKRLEDFERKITSSGRGRKRY